MTAAAIVALISMIGWLLLAGTELKGHRLERSALIKSALLWIALFMGMVVLVNALQADEAAYQFIYFT
ncbi:hypothetical protein RM533_10640 [Croceicoccus sp. F390]|uniref:Uncharacterized protein n=1 Tax=Croceicoccus esteveae TaxID=3075597 RepID=A0ABU2ZJ43_9SPHN|nr:hypothetical protein [Croceicoccus sp. F390]MDT0576638.1 hypothetical protein [Croceicoccus sp. F390]